jgi:hypothetical protein
MPKVPEKCSGVDIASAKFKSNHIDGLFIKHSSCPGEDIKFMPFYINLE